MKYVYATAICLLLAFGVMSAGTARAYDLPSQCYSPEKVMEIERGGSTAVAGFDKDQLAKLIPALIKYFRFDPWTAENALVFIRGQSVEIVYFVKGCATLETNLTAKSFQEVMKDAFWTGA